MGFDWKSAIGTIAPTVGTIIGKLLGVCEDNSAILYQFHSEENGSCEASIVKKDGELILWNRSEDENAVVTLSLPKVGDLEPQTFTLEQDGIVPLEPIFRSCASHDSTRLMITASNSTGALTRGLNGAGERFHMCAAASDVHADGNTPTRMGSFLTVVCSSDKAIFTSANHQIISISIANFQGRNDQRVKVMDIPAKPQDSGTAVEVIFPFPFPEGTTLDIDVEVEMGDLASILEEQKTWSNVSKMKLEESEQLKRIPVIR